MKKFLGIFLSFAMLFSCLTTSAFAYTDVSADKESIKVLSDLGIFDGFEDDTFKPDDYLTRAQLVKIMNCLLGYQDLATGSTKYSDVAADHWASGFVNNADALDIIAGFEDGTFKPDDKVTYEQAVKMVVCALGYAPAAQAKDGEVWYVGYVAMASSLGLTKGVNSSVGQYLTRGAVAELLYNALTTRLMDISAWGGLGTEYKQIDETILSKYLEIDKYEGIVNKTPYMAFAAGADRGELTLTDAQLYTPDGKRETVKSFETAYCDMDAEEFLGKKVVLYVGENAKDERIIFSIAEKKNYNDTLTVRASKIDTKGELSYENENGKDTKIKLASDVTAVVNFEEVVAYDLTKANGFVTFVDNDNETGYDYIIYNTYDPIGSVVNDIEVYDDIISFDAEDIDEYDPEDDDVKIVVMKNGEAASIEDIEVDDIISVAGNDNFKVYLVADKTVSGKITGIDSEENIVYIDKEAYYFNTTKYPSTSAFVLSDYVTAYFNVDDEIVDLDTDDVTLNKYVMLLRYRYDSSDDEAKIDVLTTDGEKETYVVDEKKTSAVYAEISAYLDTTTGRLLYTNLDNSIYSIKVRSKDNRLTSIKAASTDVSNWITGKTYDEETLTFGPIDLTTSTVMFSVEEPVVGITYIKAEDVTVGKATEFFTDDEGEDFSIIPFVPRDETYSILVGKDITGTISSKNDAMIIESVSEGYIDAEDETGYTITGIQNGKKVEYSLIDCAKPEKGSVILLGAKNSNGVIDKYTTLVTADTVKAGYSDTGIIGKVREIIGKVDRDNTDGTRLQLDNGQNLLLKSSANYTLVDCTSSKIKVEKKSKGISIFGSADKYESYAYVRYYDDVQTEVIVYRFNKTN